MTVIAFSQEKNITNIEATYTMEMKIDYEEALQSIPQSIRSQYGPVLKSEINEGIFVTYFLKSNSKQSTFTLEQKINNGQGDFGLIKSRISMTDNKPTYKDFTVTPNIYYKEIDFGTKQVLIKDTIPDFKWKISREKADILGHKATKAEGVITDSIPVTVWYNPQIPIKDGPYNLAGLPGLIIKAELELYGTKIIYTLKDLKILEKDFTITLPTKGEVMSGKEYSKFIKDFQKKMQEQFNEGVDIN